jgi:UDP-N-acetylmuramate dehydrogenase
MGKLKIIKNYPLAHLTTFKIGGSGEYYVRPKSIRQLKYALEFAKTNQLKITVIGGGANLLISDRGIKGLVISTSRLKKVRIDGTQVTAQSGVLVDRFNRLMIRNSLTGAEFSGGLPGSIGGAVYMNARAYGKEFADIILSVNVLNEKLETETLTLKDIDYGYKKSIFMKRPELIITDITFQMESGDKKEIRKNCKKNIKDRKMKGQFDFPSAGCIFENDYNIGIPSGRIIDELNLKGRRVGGAEVFIKHGNFIINKNHASADDIYQLIREVEKEVLDKKGIQLKREVRILGFD